MLRHNAAKHSLLYFTEIFLCSTWIIAGVCNPWHKKNKLKIFRKISRKSFLTKSYTFETVFKRGSFKTGLLCHLVTLTIIIKNILIPSAEVREAPMCQQQLMASLEEKRECVTGTATQQVIIMEVIMNSILILILLNQEGVASTRAKCCALLLITPSPPPPSYCRQDQVSPLLHSSGAWQLP